MSLKEPYKTSRIHLVYRTENSFFRGGRGGGGGGRRRLFEAGR